MDIETEEREGFKGVLLSQTADIMNLKVQCRQMKMLVILG